MFRPSNKTNKKPSDTELSVLSTNSLLTDMGNKNAQAKGSSNLAVKKENDELNKKIIQL